MFVSTKNVFHIQKEAWQNTQVIYVLIHHQSRKPCPSVRLFVRLSTYWFVRIKALISQTIIGRDTKYGVWIYVSILHADYEYFKIWLRLFFVPVNQLKLNCNGNSYASHFVCYHNNFQLPNYFWKFYCIDIDR